ncbi:MAG TPA: hypothetical protein PLZ57_08520 [Pseudobdellovibrionaceae bacterium]|nr:hypothetical protein [Pseudobdellovibrionaceae bacterium]
MRCTRSEQNQSAKLSQRNLRWVLLALSVSLVQSLWLSPTAAHEARRSRPAAAGPAAPGAPTGNSDYDSFVRNYSQHPTNRCLDQTMRGGIRVGRNLCYRAVKLGLQRTRLVSGYLPGESASGGLQALKNEGWTNLMDRYRGVANSSNAPIGAVLVYRGPWREVSRDDPSVRRGRPCSGRRTNWREGCWFQENGKTWIFSKRDSSGRQCSGLGTQHGHIEVRTTRGYSHFVESRSPIDRTHRGCRVLIGIMVKPGLESGAHSGQTVNCRAPGARPARQAARQQRRPGGRG